VCVFLVSSITIQRRPTLNLLPNSLDAEAIHVGISYFILRTALAAAFQDRRIFLSGATRPTKAHLRRPLCCRTLPLRLNHQADRWNVIQCSSSTVAVDWKHKIAAEQSLASSLSQRPAISAIFPQTRGRCASFSRLPADFLHFLLHSSPLPVMFPLDRRNPDLITLDSNFPLFPFSGGWIFCRNWLPDPNPIRCHP
jgi:hypothetical protein